MGNGQLDLDKILKYLVRADPVLKSIVKVIPKLTFSYREPNFKGLARIIINQQLSGAASRSIFSRLKNTLGENNISPNAISSLSSAVLRGCGISRSKTVYLQGLSKFFIENSEFLNELKQKDSESVIEELKRIKGIGEWSSRIFALFYLRHPDIFAVEDTSVYKAIEKLYGEGSTSTQNSLDQITNKWVPFRSVACVLFWRWIDCGMPDL